MKLFCLVCRECDVLLSYASSTQTPHRYKWDGAYYNLAPGARFTNKDM